MGWGVEVALPTHTNKKGAHQFGLAKFLLTAIGCILGKKMGRRNLPNTENNFMELWRCGCPFALARVPVKMFY